MYTYEMSTVYHYDEKALSTLAVLFAPGFVHLGAKTWMEQLPQEQELAGKKILDFGSGAGGPACFIAQNYDAQVTGVEISKLLVEYSQALAHHTKLIGRLEFIQVPELPLPFNHKFDMAYSINKISSCKNKDLVFSELSRVLRSHATLIIMDWFHKSAHYSEATQAFFKFTDGIFYLNTPQEYLQQLEKNKLSYVNFKDNTKNTLKLCETLITELKTTHQGEIVTQFGAEYFEWWLEYWSLLYAAMQSGDLLTGHVRGIRT